MAPLISQRAVEHMLLFLYYRCCDLSFFGLSFPAALDPLDGSRLNLESQSAFLDIRSWWVLLNAYMKTQLMGYLLDIISYSFVHSLSPKLVDWTTHVHQSCRMLFRLPSMTCHYHYHLHHSALNSMAIPIDQCPSAQVLLWNKIEYASLTGSRPTNARKEHRSTGRLTI